MSTQELVKSKKIKVAVAVVGFFLIVFISFAGGVAVGLHKAILWDRKKGMAEKKNLLVVLAR